MNILKKAAEILVESGFYFEIDAIMDGRKVSHYRGFFDEHNGTRDYRKSERIEPFADTIEGRRQVDAIEDWLLRQPNGIWNLSNHKVGGLYGGNKTTYQWRLDRIKWCLDELCK